MPYKDPKGSHRVVDMGLPLGVMSEVPKAGDCL